MGDDGKYEEVPGRRFGMVLIPVQVATGSMSVASWTMDPNLVDHTTGTVRMSACPHSDLESLPVWPLALSMLVLIAVFWPRNSHRREAKCILCRGVDDLQHQMSRIAYALLSPNRVDGAARCSEQLSICRRNAKDLHLHRRYQ